MAGAGWQSPLGENRPNSLPDNKKTSSLRLKVITLKQKLVVRMLNAEGGIVVKLRQTPTIVII